MSQQIYRSIYSYFIDSSEMGARRKSPRVTYWAPDMSGAPWAISKHVMLDSWHDWRRIDIGLSNTWRFTILSSGCVAEGRSITKFVNIFVPIQCQLYSNEIRTEAGTIYLKSEHRAWSVTLRWRVSGARSPAFHHAPPFCGGSSM